MMHCLSLPGHQLDNKQVSKEVIFATQLEAQKEHLSMREKELKQYLDEAKNDAQQLKKDV